MWVSRCLVTGPQERIKSEQPKAIILSGGPNSVHVADAPQLPAGFFDYIKENKIPVLGICYGMQLLVQVRLSCLVQYALPYHQSDSVMHNSAAACPTALHSHIDPKSQ